MQDCCFLSCGSPLSPTSQSLTLTHSLLLSLFRPYQHTNTQKQVSAKDREIASLADKLESALQAAADATVAAATTSGGIGALKGVVSSDNEVRKAIAQAQAQVRQAQRQRVCV